METNPMTALPVEELTEQEMIETVGGGDHQPYAGYGMRDSRGITNDFNPAPERDGRRDFHAY